MTKTLPPPNMDWWEKSKSDKLRNQILHIKLYSFQEYERYHKQSNIIYAALGCMALPTLDMVSLLRWLEMNLPASTSLSKFVPVCIPIP